MNAFALTNAQTRGLGMTSQRTRDRLIDRLAAEGVRDRRVLEVLARLPRHLFIEEALSSRAYEDTALPIGKGQTISQPWVVARMTAGADRIRPAATCAGSGHWFRLSGCGVGGVGGTGLYRGTH